MNQSINQSICISVCLSVRLPLSLTVSLFISLFGSEESLLRLVLFDNENNVPFIYSNETSNQPGSSDNKQLAIINLVKHEQHLIKQVNVKSPGALC